MLPSKIQQQFEGWEVDLDPENFNLLSLLKFRQSKGDFSFKKSVEHTLISKFVSYVEGSADEKWRKAASLLNETESRSSKQRGNREEVGQFVDATT
ncbi:hypothetical protein BC936DRAFT_140606 [Jimgerdemannia flammicorona]|uniref:Uncharacterized protein n=1 Tax=Jimgerdemannia flammicorona TaxID=994334 RepID=A0A433AK05_9FUNG|nr:hypothetical protein BC936DRAFT_140606 [Jimgerdemannia flammicorona]